MVFVFFYMYPFMCVCVYVSKDVSFYQNFYQVEGLLYKQIVQKLHCQSEFTVNLNYLIDFTINKDTPQNVHIVYTLRCTNIAGRSPQRRIFPICFT